MPAANPTALNFLLTSASYPAKLMAGPVPDRAALMVMLKAASRSPDHGKLVPWRFVVMERDALQRMAALAIERGQALGQLGDPRFRRVLWLGLLLSVVLLIGA